MSITPITSGVSFRIPGVWSGTTSGLVTIVGPQVFVRVFSGTGLISGVRTGQISGSGTALLTGTGSGVVTGRASGVVVSGSGVATGNNSITGFSGSGSGTSGDFLYSGTGTGCGVVTGRDGVTALALISGSGTGIQTWTGLRTGTGLLTGVITGTGFFTGVLTGLITGTGTGVFTAIATGSGSGTGLVTGSGTGFAVQLLGVPSGSGTGTGLVTGFAPSPGLVPLPSSMQWVRGLGLICSYQLYRGVFALNYDGMCDTRSLFESAPSAGSGTGATSYRIAISRFMMSGDGSLWCRYRSLSTTPTLYRRAPVDPIGGVPLFAQAVDDWFYDDPSVSANGQGIGALLLRDRYLFTESGRIYSGPLSGTGSGSIAIETTVYTPASGGPASGLPAEGGFFSPFNLDQNVWLVCFGDGRICKYDVLNKLVLGPVTGFRTPVFPARGFAYDAASRLVFVQSGTASGQLSTTPPQFSIWSLDVVPTNLSNPVLSETPSFATSCTVTAVLTGDLGEPVPGRNITFLVSGSGSGTVTPATVETDESGVATSTYYPPFSGTGSLSGVVITASLNT